MVTQVGFMYIYMDQCICVNVYIYIYMYVRRAIVGLRRQTDRQRKQEKMSPQKTHDITAEN